jgi:hypothetical protein
MYLGVTFDRMTTWRHHIAKTVAKALCTYLRTYSLFKSKHLSTNIKLTLYKALIRLVMTYACPTWNYAVDAHLLKLQYLQNSSPHNWKTWQTHNCTWNVTFKIPYVYNYITRLCRTEAEVILSHRKQTVHGIGEGEAMHQKYKRLKLGSGQTYDHSAD